ncbi:Ubiquinone biosynthesis O-methyltransferase [mine drainage metagenome]|uniref:Ubiquinone biosynthesis O-methyltransferase n=1 Tax=mine drainage metagenome TaxID=410659 RepID=T1B4X6_9ZZZZ
MSWAEDWWDPDGSYATLHHINPVRLSFMKKRVDLAGRHILDIGCGGGILTEALAQAGAEVTGIDTSPEAIRIAEAHARKQGLGIHYQVGEASDLLQKRRQSFDIVTCFELVEHVPDPRTIIQNAAELTRLGGTVLVSTINRTLRAWLFAIVAAEHVLQLTPRGLHRYDRFRTPEEIEDWAKAAGLRLCDRRGLLYLPWLHTAFLTGDLSVNYLLHFERTS